MMSPLQSKKLSMLLAMRLSALLDSSKPNYLSKAAWAQQLADTAELVQVI
jgi:hypothetical protein